MADECNAAEPMGDPVVTIETGSGPGFNSDTAILRRYGGPGNLLNTVKIQVWHKENGETKYRDDTGIDLAVWSGNNTWLVVPTRMLERTPENEIACSLGLPVGVLEGLHDVDFSVRTNGEVDLQTFLDNQAAARQRDGGRSAGD